MSEAMNAALARYWGARSPQDERRAYADILSLGGPLSNGETPEEAARFLAEYGLALPGDILSSIRDVARRA